jgi:hypothetical protein
MPKPKPKELHTVSDYDPWSWNGPAYAREYLNPREPMPVRRDHHPPDVVLPPGAYSYCFRCTTNLGPGQRCTEPEQFFKLRNAGAHELLSVPCCPLDLADEIAARRARRAAVIEPLPQRESKPSRWRRWWRKEK